MALTMFEAPDEWTGRDLDNPESVSMFVGQLHTRLTKQAAYIATIREDAVAYWKANPPDGYGWCEKRFRAWWVATPFGQIEEHLRDAAKLTHQLEARHRVGRHELPAKRLEAKAAKQAKKGKAPALGGASRPVTAPRPGTPPPLPRTDQPAGGRVRSFLDLIADVDNERRSA